MKTKALELARDLSERSTIKIKVGAVIYTKNKILSWGWNNPGDGYGDHAEHMAVRRFIRAYRNVSSIPAYIAVFSTRKGKSITSRPCGNCEKLLRSVGVRGADYFRKEELDGKFVRYLVSEEYV